MFTNISNELENKGYKVSCFTTKEKAVAYLCGEISGKTVGMGGSETIRQMDLFAALSKNNTVYSHANLENGRSAMETRQLATAAQVYISSVNGIAETGEIVNIDGCGNRVAAISFGPEKVYLLVGKQKLTKDLSSAIDYARNVAAPKNAKRLGLKTPCAVNADKCYNCNSPQRICRNMSILMAKPSGSEYEVILIDEELGY